jgi:N-methylhydantoinase A
MSLRTAVIAHRRPIALDGLRGAAAPGGAVGTRKVWFDSQSNNWHDTPIYRREGLPAGTVLTGPAIVEQLDATTVIEPGDHARVDAFGNLEITVRGA